MNLIPWRNKSRQGTESAGGELSTVVDFRREMDRLFDSFFREPFWPSAGEGVLGGLTAWSPALDVAETNDEVEVRAEIPGVDPKQLDIAVQGNRLVISGEKKETKESKENAFHRRESYYGSFTRELQLPGGVDAGKVDATYADGVLTIRLKKSPNAAPKKIPVKTG
jgi:HSP20 family protein